jgi:AcrR family transcriptional regulator
MHMDSPHQQQDTKLRILQEAERLFRHYGYGKTTIADISQACGMSAANVYRFYPSKSALMEAICGRLISDTEMRLHQIVRRDTSASERLTAFIAELHRNAMENLLDHHKVHEMVMVAMEEQWLAIRNHVDRIAAYLGELINDGIARGEFARRDPQRVGKIVHTALACFCHPAMVAQKLDDEDRIRPEEMAAFLIAALKNS